MMQSTQDPSKHTPFGQSSSVQHWGATQEFATQLEQPPFTLQSSSATHSTHSHQDTPRQGSLHRCSMLEIHTGYLDRLHSFHSHHPLYRAHTRHPDKHHLDSLHPHSM